MRQDSIGPLHIGMTKSELTSTGLPVEFKQVNLEGDLYERGSVTIAPEQIVEATLDSDGRVHELATRSPAITAEGGGRVGDTLAHLQELYAGSNFFWGIAEGPYANLETPNGIYFKFDTAMLSRSCLTQNVDCPDMGNFRAVEFYFR